MIKIIPIDLKHINEYYNILSKIVNINGKCKILDQVVIYKLIL